MLEQKAAYRKRYAEKLAAKQKVYYRENAEACNATIRAWKERNAEKLRYWHWLRYNLDPEVRAVKSARTKANPQWGANARMKREAALLRQIPAWANIDAIKAIYQEAARRRAAGEDVHVDHIVPLNSPLARGFHSEHNLQILPAKVNLKKGNRLA